MTSSYSADKMPELSLDEGAGTGLSLRKSVVVHSGARDAYQLARALSEAGLLEALVTDLYWPRTGTASRILSSVLPSRLLRLMQQRSDPALPAAEVKMCPAAGLATLLLDKLPGVPFRWRRRAARRADATLGRVAGELARLRGANLVSYSYYAHAAFAHFRRPGILFQLHPHPLSMRRILTEELEAHPECADSLRQEWELSLPETDFARLVEETTLPCHILAASSFTRSTLIEHGTRPEQVTVIPYGVDCARFYPSNPRRSRADGKLQLLFVGRINQRKGVKYLLDALRLLASDQVHLLICGRVVDGLELFQPFASQVEIRPSVSHAELLAAYQEADLFVFPSVAEGFGQVLLESLACGLPILATTHTAAPDLIEEGVEGFIVPPRRPDLIAHRLAWALAHRPELEAMRPQARARAEQFTWQRFRAGVVQAIRSHQLRSQQMPPQQETQSEVELSHA